MRRFGGQDDGFFHLETPTAPMNSMAVGVLRPAPGPDGRPRPVTIDDVRAHMAARLGDMPSLRWRYQAVPLRLHHPVAIEDPDFDLDFHIRHARVPSPGGARELDRLVARISEQHLDRRHPLWQLTLVDGLADGQQAAIYRVHHALQDGVAAYTSFSRVFSGTDEPVAESPGSWEPDPVPGRLRLLGDALRDQARNLAGFGELFTRTQQGTKAAKAREADSPIKVPGFVTDTPPCSLNDAFTLDRTYARSALPLADVKAVKQAAGVTLNDVLLAVVATGLRNHLIEAGDLPDRPLVANVPVGYEPPDAPTRQFGNRFTSITTSLATDVVDPWERLMTISSVCREALDRLELAGPELMADWLEAVPPFIAEPGIRSLQKRRRTHREEAEHNVVISNIKGPTERWRFVDAEVTELHIQGPPSNGVGPNVMVWSYVDQLLISVLSFADAVPDPHRLSERFAEALDELLVRARRPAPA